MKKSQYLPFHAKALFESTENKGINLYFNPLNNCIVDYVGVGFEKIVSSDQLFEKFKNKASFLVLINKPLIFELYFAYLHDNATDEHRHFALINNPLAMNIELNTFNNILSNLSYNKKYMAEFLTLSHPSIGVMDYKDIEKTASLIKNANLPVELLMNYLTVRQNQLDKTHKKHAIINAIENNFSDQTEVFSSLKFVQEYFKNKNESIIEDTKINATHNIRFNCNKLESQCRFPFYTIGTYRTLFNEFVNALDKFEDLSGIVNVAYHERINKNNYLYTDVYIDLNDKSYYTKPMLNELLIDFSYYVKMSPPVQEDVNTKFDNYAHNWLSKKLFNDKLEHDLSQVDKSAKSTKIKI